MANWTTEWTTHPDYPGWRKRRLVDPKTGMQAMLQTFWERIPGSDPTLPGPPGSERGGNPFLPPSWKRPDFGKFPKLPPGKPYRPPSGTHEMPGIPGRPARPPGWHNLPEKFPDGFNPFLRPNPYRPPPPPSWGKFPDRLRPVPFPEMEEYPDRVRPVPMPGIGGYGDLPEYDPESKWYNPNWKQDIERERGLPPGHLVHITPPSQSERMREQFNLGGNFGDNNFSKLLKDAQVGSEMGRTRGLRRENMMIPPGKRKRYPAEFDPATGQNRVVPGTLRTTYPDEERVTGPQLGGVPEGDRKFVDSMHAIQSAYFTGADFGYEGEWAERLGVPEEQIAMFMAVPEEAIKHAMNNPTDAVLEQFEEYYGFPLNVNDPDMREYFETQDRGVGSRGKWNQDHLDGQMLGKLYQDGDGYYAIMDPEGESRFG